MTLPRVFALDSETDSVPGYDEPRTVLVTTCSIDATDESFVQCYPGLTCWNDFLNEFAECGHDCECVCYNLTYEWSRMRFEMLPNMTYKWSDTLSEMQKARDRENEVGHWTIVEDALGGVYEILFCNRRNHLLRITDDSKRVSSDNMDSLGRMMHSYADFPQLAKKDIPKDWYNSGWSNPRAENHLEMQQYAITDCFVQAMIAKGLRALGPGCVLTKSTYGFEVALSWLFEHPTSHPAEIQRMINHTKFKKMYPPLDPEMQTIAEHSLIGGYVYGVPGDWRGTFCHIDFSSSYPYEMYAGESFIGQVKRSTDCEMFRKLEASPNLMRWVLVSFDFTLQENGLPLLGGNEVEFPPWEPASGRIRLKFRHGHCSRRLYTEQYWQELQRHYSCSNIEKHEIWYAARHEPVFRRFIQTQYEAKSQCKQEGRKLEAQLAKDLMNTGPHGKTIQRTRRRSCIYPENERIYVERINEPKVQMMLGWSNIQNARARLARWGRIIQEHGIRVMMCDTDSIVAACPSETLESILGDWVVRGTSIENIGKWSFETDSCGERDFDRFICWGLKRYCEMNSGNVRKTAFAGMHRRNQARILPTAGDVLEWDDEQMVTGDWGKHMVTVHKYAERESIYGD